MAGDGGRARVSLLALELLSAFGPLSLDLYLPGLPQIGADLAATDAQAQLTLSASLAGLALGQLFAGPLSDRVGRRRPLLIGMAAFAATSVLCALAPTIWFLVVARLAQGFAGASGLVLSRAVVRDRYADHEIAHVFSLLMLVNGMAPVLAPLLGGVLLHVMPWRGLFYVLAVGRGHGGPDRRSAHRGARRLVRRPRPCEGPPGQPPGAWGRRRGCGHPRLSLSRPVGRGASRARIHDTCPNP
jgi:multidrug resistance protein